jgi:hypothetical protein
MQVVVLSLRLSQLDYIIATVSPGRLAAHNRLATLSIVPDVLHFLLLTNHVLELRRGGEVLLNSIHEVKRVLGLEGNHLLNELHQYISVAETTCMEAELKGVFNFECNLDAFLTIDLCFFIAKHPLEGCIFVFANDC